MEILLYIMAGAGVGFAVGLTGVGGGSLMTPLLLVFGFSAPVAVGTDLLYASLTKASSLYSHQRLRNIQWPIVLRLAAGSLPASGLTVFLLAHFFQGAGDYRSLLMSTLGVMLILTAVVLLFRSHLQHLKRESRLLARLRQHRSALTVLCGIVLGAAVTLSSVGAGAIGTAVLMLLYPELPTTRIVGTDIAHAVPLTLIAGLGHWELGNINLSLLLALLVGSVPAIHLGALLGRRIPDRLLQSGLASVLLVMGLKYVFF